MRGDLLKELDVRRRERVGAAAGQIERAESAAMSDEGNATDGLDAFAAQDADNFGIEAVDLNAAEDERLAIGEAATRGRGIERDSRFFLDEVPAAGKIESMNLEQSGEGVKESEAGEVVVDDALEGGDNAAKEIGQLAAGDEKVVELEKDLEAVALAGELLLISL